MANAGSTLLGAAGLATAGYFGYRYWQREQMRAAMMAEAARLQARGASVKDAITDAAATACKVTGAAYGVPPAASGPICSGAAALAIKGAELASKGAVIAGKAIGKGVVIGGKAVGHGAAVVGKDVGKGAKFVAYTVPRKVIGTAVTKSIDATVGRIIPKKAAKVVKKVLCLGIFCGLEGVDDYRSLYDSALGDAAPSPFGRARQLRPSGPNPFRQLGRAQLAPIGGAVARGVLRAGNRPAHRAGTFLRAP